MALSTYARNLTCTHLFTASAVTRPAAWHLALMTSAPTDDGGGVEVTTSGSGYARRPASFSITPGNASTASKAVTTAAVEYAKATSSWGTITHVAVYTLPTGGDLLFWAPLDVAKNISAGDIFRDETLTFELI